MGSVKHDQCDKETYKVLVELSSNACYHFLGHLKMYFERMSQGVCINDVKAIHISADIALVQRFHIFLNIYTSKL